MELNNLKTDYEKATGGVWVDYSDGVRFLVAKKPNPLFDEELAKLLEPHLASLSAGTFDDALDKLITAKTCAKTILLGWENITVDGIELEYSFENALMILTDKQLTDVKRFVLMIAHSSERYRIQELEEAEKNL